MHISAQGDQPISLAYFKQKGISVTSKDEKGSTPLHWAAYIGYFSKFFLKKKKYLKDAKMQ